MENIEKNKRKKIGGWRRWLEYGIEYSESKSSIRCQIKKKKRMKSR